MGESRGYTENNETEPAKKQNCTLISEISDPGLEYVIRLKVKNIEERTAVNGNVYQKLYCRDISGCETTVINWNMQRRLTTDLSKYPFVGNMTVCPDINREGTMYCLLCGMEVLDNSTLDDFEPENHIDPKSAVETINAYISRLSPFLKELVKNTLNRIYKPFIAYPLTSNKAFSRRCGILEATCKLLDLTEKVISAFQVDSNIMTAAALLYYCGFTITMNRSYSLMSGALLGDGAAADVLSVAYLRTIENKEFRTADCELQYRWVRNIIACREDTAYTKETENESGPSCPLFTKEAKLMRHLHEMMVEADYIEENSKTASDYTVVNLQTGEKLFKTPACMTAASNNVNKEETSPEEIV